MVETVLPMTEPKTEEIQEIQEVIKREDYAGIWYNTQPLLIMNVYKYGSKNLSKMIDFLLEAKPKKEDIDFWNNKEHFPLNRKPEENTEDYHIRRKFINALFKYRKEVRSFTVMFFIQEAQKEADKLKSENKKQETINQIKENKIEE